MGRLNGQPWNVSSLLLYAGVAGCALLVASVMSIGLETNGSHPILRAAMVDRTAPRPGAPQIPASSVLPSPTASAIVPPASAIAPAPARSGGSGNLQRAGSSPAGPQQARTTPTAQPTPIQPQTVPPDSSVVEIPTADSSAQPSPTDSPSPATDSPTPATDSPTPATDSPTPAGSGN